MVFEQVFANVLLVINQQLVVALWQDSDRSLSFHEVFHDRLVAFLENWELLSIFNKDVYWQLN